MITIHGFRGEGRYYTTTGEGVSAVDPEQLIIDRSVPVQELWVSFIVMNRTISIGGGGRTGLRVRVLDVRINEENHFDLIVESPHLLGISRIGLRPRKNSEPDPNAEVYWAE